MSHAPNLGRGRARRKPDLIEVHLTRGGPPLSPGHESGQCLSESPLVHLEAGDPYVTLPTIQTVHIRRLGFAAGCILTAALGACDGGPPPPSDPDVVWAEAESWAYEGSTLLGDDWTFATAAADSISETVVARIEAAAAGIAGGLRVLAITRHGCIDSAHSVPYIAAAVERVDAVEFRYVEPSLGRTLMDEHPTFDGRGATPTVLLLDTAGTVRGCWLERPAALQHWYLENPEDLGRVARFAAKTEWYEADKGAHALAEFAQIIEQAAAGETVCGLQPEPVSELPEPGRPNTAGPVG